MKKLLLLLVLLPIGFASLQAINVQDQLEMLISMGKQEKEDWLDNRLNYDKQFFAIMKDQHDDWFDWKIDLVKDYGNKNALKKHLDEAIALKKQHRLDWKAFNKNTQKQIMDLVAKHDAAFNKFQEDVR